MEKFDKKMMETSRFERSGYYSYFAGQNMLYIFVTMFLSVYFATILGIPAATIGFILLGARVWDAINDPILSVFIEKSNLKSGKFKPWINGVAIALPISTIIMFSFSSFLINSPMYLRVIYATITYIIWGMIYTISDAPAFALATVMTSKPQERNIIISLSKLFAFLGIMVSMIMAPVLIEKTGNNWMLISAVMSTVAFIFIVQVRRTKERVPQSENSPTLKEIGGAIFKNKYTVLYVIVLVVSSGFNFGMTIMPFIANDIFKDPSITSILMLSTTLPILFIIPIVPRLINKFGKRTIYIFSSLALIILSLITYLVGYDNFTIFLILNIIKALFGSLGMVLPALFFADCIDYLYYQTGKRFEAATFAVQTFSNKAVAAISGAGAMGLLALFGYVESTGGIIVEQSSEVIDGMWMIFNLGPAVGGVISIIIFWIHYDLTEKKLYSMKADFENRENK